MNYKYSNIKKWFADKWYSELSVGAKRSLGFSDVDGQVIDETEKAVRLSFEGNYGHVAYWFPKSVFMTDEEKAESDKQWEIKRQDAIDFGKARYDKLVAFAKENKLSVKNRMKTSTIMNIISEAGLEYNN